MGSASVTRQGNTASQDTLQLLEAMGPVGVFAKMLEGLADGPRQPEPRCIAARTLLGKTPRWSRRENRLYLVDIMGPAILAANM